MPKAKNSQDHDMSCPEIICCLSRGSLQEIKLALEKKQAGMKRKLGQLQEQQSALLADAETRIAKISRKASRLPEVAKMLQPFV